MTLSRTTDPVGAQANNANIKTPCFKLCFAIVMAANQHKFAVVVAFYFIEMQNTIFLNSVTLMKPSISSKVKPIMSAQSDRKKANRCKNYVECVVPNYILDEFQQHFRITRGTFEMDPGHFAPITTSRQVDYLHCIWVICQNSQIF